MTRKIYKSAMGKTVDLGALLLQNENTRAVGNMNINARGDILDSANRITEKKNHQVQRKYRKQTNVSTGPVATSTREAKQQLNQTGVIDDTDTFEDLPEEEFDEVEKIAEPVQKAETKPLRGGLAAAIARSREIKQELDKPLRQRDIGPGVKKI
jgi:hypothetical protein